MIDPTSAADLLATFAFGTLTGVIGFAVGDLAARRALRRSELDIEEPADTELRRRVAALEEQVKAQNRQADYVLNATWRVEPRPAPLPRHERHHVGAGQRGGA